MSHLSSIKSYGNQKPYYGGKMPSYTWSARDKSGELVIQEIEAADADDAKYISCAGGFTGQNGTKVCPHASGSGGLGFGLPAREAAGHQTSASWSYLTENHMVFLTAKTMDQHRIVTT